MTRTIPILSIPLLLGGCAGQQLPQSHVSQTHAAIESTHEIQRTREDIDPQVDLYIKYAREQLATAERLMEDGRERGARRMLERANADADLALALARSDSSKRRAEEAKQAVAELRDNKSEHPSS